MCQGPHLGSLWPALPGVYQTMWPLWPCLRSNASAPFQSLDSPLQKDLRDLNNEALPGGVLYTIFYSTTFGNPPDWWRALRFLVGGTQNTPFRITAKV
jgi:hypothetical protein